jgi:imidazolonepropionase-like amidohydrolase
MDAAPHVAVAGPLISTVARPMLDLGDPPIEHAESPAQAAALARERLRRGADFLKVWLIHHRGDDLSAQTELVRAVAEVAHEADEPLVVHATELRVAKAALRAGADVLAHSVRDALVDDEFLRLARDRDVVYIPTLHVRSGYDLALSGAFEPTALERELASPEVLSMLEELERRRPASGTSPSRFAVQNLQRVWRSGITVAVGSDAGNIGTLHGPGFFRELHRLAEAGLTPPQILKAATLNGAEAMGMEDRSARSPRAAWRTC